MSRPIRNEDRNFRRLNARITTISYNRVMYAVETRKLTEVGCTLASFLDEILRKLPPHPDEGKPRRQPRTIRTSGAA